MVDAEVSEMRTSAISVAEYQDRVRAIRRKMEEQQLDALFIFSDEYRCGNTLYVTGYKPINVIEESPQAVFLPLQGEPQVFLGHINAQSARKVSWIDQIHSTGELYEKLSPLATGLKRIGMVGENLLPLTIYRELQRAFPDAELVSCPVLVNELRQVKSEAELKWVEEACKLGDIGLQTAIESIEAGQTEIEVCAVAEHATRTRGGDLGCAYIVSAGQHMSLPTWRPDHTVIRQGDVVMVDIAPSYKMYCTDVAVTVPVGPPSSDQRRALQVAREVALEVVEKTGPGMPANSMYQEMRSRLERAGYADYFLPYAKGFRAIGHGVGLDVVEFPNLGPESDYLLVPNMVLGLKLDLHGLAFGGVRAEITVAITETGCRPLNNILTNEVAVQAMEHGVG